jgi:hypothetical protein
MITSNTSHKYFILDT